MTWFVKSDESCVGKGHQYLAVSGIAISSENNGILSEGIDRWRERVNMRAELKWGKVSSKKLDEYKQFVDGGVRWIKNRELAFRSLLVPRDQIRYGEFHDGSEELGLFKFTYQLLLHCLVPVIPDGEPIVLHPDKRNLRNPALLGEFRNALENGIRKHFGYRRNPILKVEQFDSKNCNVLQLNDVLLGAVQFQNNGRDSLPNARAEKVALARHLAMKMGVPNLCESTPRSSTHFGIWKFRFKPRIERSA